MNTTTNPLRVVFYDDRGGHDRTQCIEYDFVNGRSIVRCHASCSCRRPPEVTVDPNVRAGR